MDKYSKRVAVKIILLSELLSEAIDEAQNTTFYNHALKNLIRKVSSKLEPFNRKHYDAIYDNQVSRSINVLDTILDELTHCKIEGFNPVEQFNLYLVKDSNGNTVKVKSTLSLSEFNDKYRIKRKVI